MAVIFILWPLAVITQKSTNTPQPKLPLTSLIHREKGYGASFRVHIYST